jgi:hypothetical protein
MRTAIHIEMKVGFLLKEVSSCNIWLNKTEATKQTAAIFRCAGSKMHFFHFHLLETRQDS